MRISPDERRRAWLIALVFVNCLPLPLYAAFYNGGGPVLIPLLFAVPFMLFPIDMGCTETRKHRAAVLVPLWLSSVSGVWVSGQLYLQMVYYDSIGEEIFKLLFFVEVIYVGVLAGCGVYCGKRK